jgi:hypothetical protein
MRAAWHSAYCSLLDDQPAEPAMSDRKVLPFRKRPPSEEELEVYRQITRNWHPEMRRTMLPEHFKRDQRGAKG